MKRLVAVLAVGALLLALPATVLAKFVAYHGPAAGGVNNADIDMDVVWKKGHAPTLVRFEFNNIPGYGCGSSATWFSRSLPHPKKIAISHGKFHGKQTVKVGVTPFVVTVRGHVTQHKAAGTLRIKGNFSSCGTVDTGVLSWSAPKVG